MATQHIEGTIKQYRLCTLTKLEFAIAYGIIKDLTMDEIAGDLSMSVSNIRYHASSMYKKCFVPGEGKEKRNNFYNAYYDDVLFLYELIDGDVDRWLRTPKKPLDPITEDLLNAIIKDREEKIKAGIPIEEEDDDHHMCPYEKQLNDYMQLHWKEYIGKLWPK